MAEDARTVVAGYFDAWKARDFPTMRSLLADRFDFAGPIDRFDSADAYQQAVQGLSQMITDIVVHKTFTDGADVLTWYDLHTKITDPAPVAEWSHVENGKITRVQAVFDARPFSPPAGH
jgi:SnoaL-like domain